MAKEQHGYKRRECHRVTRECNEGVPVTILLVVISMTGSEDEEVVFPVNDNANRT